MFILIFIDIKAAFDSVDCQTICKALGSQESPSILHSPHTSMHEITTAGSDFCFLLDNFKRTPRLCSCPMLFCQAIDHSAAHPSVFISEGRGSKTKITLTTQHFSSAYTKCRGVARGGQSHPQFPVGKISK